MSAAATIGDVKAMILLALRWFFCEVRDVRLVSGTRNLDDGRSLGDYNIHSGSCLWMLFRLRGGMDDDDGDAMDDLSLELPEQVECINF